MEQQQELVVNIKNATVKLNNNIILDNLSWQLEKGSHHFILGANGAGKTTLLKLLCGLLCAKSGNISLFGYNPKQRNPNLLKEIFFIPEEFDTPNLKIQEILYIYAPFYPHFDYNLFKEYLHEFDLNTNQSLTTASYGQKKKAFLAFGLATGCKLLIMDEPTNGLDIPSKRQFRKLLVSNLTEERIFLISTHQVRDMNNLIDPIIILDNGEIIFQEQIDKINIKFSLNLSPNEPDDDECLYYEKVVGGYSILEKNMEHIDEDIDLEILFNAVIHNKEKINEIVR